MKNLIILFLAAALAFSCNTDKCKDVVCAVGTCEDGLCVDPCDSIDCGIGGTCTTGLCICDAGYSQDSAGACNIEWSAKFLGANVATQDICTGLNVGTFNYNMTLARTSPTAISTTNFAGYGASNVVSLDVTSSNTLSVNYTDVSNRVFTGSGSIVNGVITMDVIVDFPNGTVNDTCVTTITL